MNARQIRTESSKALRRQSAAVAFVAERSDDSRAYRREKEHAESLLDEARKLEQQALVELTIVWEAYRCGFVAGGGMAEHAAPMWNVSGAREEAVRRLGIVEPCALAAHEEGKG